MDVGSKSPVGRLDRYRLHGFLVLEQLLGAKHFARWFGRRQELAYENLAKRLRARPPATRRLVERSERFSYEEFREYFRRGRPVIFSGAATNWGCVRKWNFDFFSAGYGGHDLLLVNAAGLSSREEKPGYEFLPLRELVQNIRDGGEKYLRFSPLLHENPALVSDLDLGWFDRMRGAGSFARTYYMFLGGAGQRTLLHNDQPCNFFVQVHGEKKWTLFSPRDSALLYPRAGTTAYVRSQVTLAAPDADAFPLFAYATPFEAHLRPGDILYVPPFWWHEVENLSETIAVSYRFSSLAAALRSSAAFLAVRVLSTNPPIWKTMRYGKQDTNLIWAHAGGFVREVMAERAARGRAKNGSGRE